MKIFEITKEIKAVCRSENTRSGFRHLATLLINDVEVAEAKACYQNRTWERYEFQSVLSNLISKADLTEKQRKVAEKFVEEGKEDLSHLKTIGAIAQLGELFCDNQKDKNDWKKRMLKAGLENKGLTFPDDWDTLTEEQKESRLNKAVEVL